MKIQNGDRVIVCKGSDKGKEGEVIGVLRESSKVIISGVNIRTIHKKPKTNEEKGSIEKKEMPIDLSNVMIVDPKTKKRTRVSYEGVGKEKKRITKKSGTVLKKSIKKKKKEREVGEAVVKSEGTKKTEKTKKTEETT